MPMYDFECESGEHKFEDVVPFEQRAMPCPSCGKNAIRLVGKTVSFTTIIPSHNHSKRLKAGHQHTHADRPKTPGKIQVGYNGPSKR